MPAGEGLGKTACARLLCHGLAAVRGKEVDVGQLDRRRKRQEEHARARGSRAARCSRRRPPCRCHSASGRCGQGAPLRLRPWEKAPPRESRLACIRRRGLKSEKIVDHPLDRSQQHRAERFGLAQQRKRISSDWRSSIDLVAILLNRLNDRWHDSGPGEIPSSQTWICRLLTPMSHQPTLVPSHALVRRATLPVLSHWTTVA